jgi:hypothetical protein
VKVRITQTPRETELDGVRLEVLRAGMIRDVSPISAAGSSCRDTPNRKCAEWTACQKSERTSSARLVMTGGAATDDPPVFGCGINIDKRSLVFDADVSRR